MQAHEVMTPYANCCVPSSSARMASRLMKQFQVGILPVIDDHSSHKLVGVVTDRDLCVRALASTDNPGDVPVEICMTANPAYCTPETDVRKVLALMAIRRVHRIPVVDHENRVKGMISIDDLIRHEAVATNHICLALRRIATPPKPRLKGRAAGI